jgi:plastocyanin
MHRALCLIALLSAGPALAAPAPVLMALEHHIFSPASVTVPAGERITIELTNHDKTAEEFESHDLKVEKVVSGGGHATITIGPLKPGTYKFMGEYHPATAQGQIIASGH